MFKNGTALDHKDLMNVVREAMTGYAEVTVPITYSGTGDGLLTQMASPPPGVSEVWTMVCTTPGGFGVGIFSVTGSVSGAQAAATVGTFYDGAGGLFEFVINDGPADFIVSDQFDVTVTQNALVVAGQEWAEKRFSPGVNDVESSTVDFPNNALNQAASNDASLVGLTAGILHMRFDYAIELDEYKVRGTDVLVDLPDNPTDWTFEFSDDGVNYTVADTVVGSIFTVTEIKTFALGSPGRHLFWRLNITAVDGGSNLKFAELQAHITGQDANINSLFSGDESPMLEGKGIAGTDNIFFGMRIQENILTPYFNWDIFGMTAYVDALILTDQPGLSPSQGKYVSNDAPMEFWIFATGRYLHLVTKVSTDYTNMSMGFFLPYAVPSEYVYPMAIMGGSGLNRHFSSTDIRHQQCFDPSEDACYIRSPGGQWVQIENQTSSAVFVNNVWPFGGGGGQAFSSFRDEISDGLDGTYELFPLLFITSEARLTPILPDEANMYGEIEDVFMVSGSNNSAENTITVNGDTYIVFQNIFRTTFTDFYAIKVIP